MSEREREGWFVSKQKAESEKGWTVMAVNTHHLLLKTNPFEHQT